MATVDVTYAPAAGRKFVTLTSWAGDAAFSPTPVADGQIEGPDALTMGADGVVTGSDGTYALTYISPSGNIQAASYEIGEAAESATVTATYAPATGRQVVTLTSWAGSADFATTPTAGSQIEGANALTIGDDGVITGPDGTYAIHHITTAGVIEADSFAIATADTTDPVISALTATGTDPDTIDVAFSTDEDNGTAYFFASGSASETAAAIKAGAQGSQTVSATGDQSLTITLATGTYRIHAMHEDTAGNQSNVLSSAEIVLAEVDAGTETGTGTATYSPPGNMTLTTVQEPVDEYLTDGWSSPPETGEQVLTFTAEGAFDPQLNWSGPAEGAFDYYYINNDGNFYERTITTGSLDSLADTTPAAFSFTDVTGQPVSTVTESNIITITGVDAATDVAASITGGEYAVSTDDGATFGAYTSAATNVQLDDQIKVRVTTSANNSTGTGAAFTAGGVTDTFTATTEAGVDITPDAFTLGADVAGAELSVNTDRSFVVAGLDSAQTFTATGDGTVSLTDGSGYVSSVSAKTGDTVYFRLPASGSYATAATGGLGCNGVTDAMSVTTREQVAPVLASTASYTKRIDSAASGTLSLTGGDAAASWSDPSGTDGAQYTITSSGVWTRTSNNPTEEDETFTTTATNAAGTSEAQTVTVSYVEQLIGNMWRPSLSSLKIGL